MPDNPNEWLWWAFNGSLLFGLWLIKREVTRNNDIQERNGRNNHRMYVFMMQMNARCSLFHPDRPALVPPEWED